MATTIHGSGFRVRFRRFFYQRYQNLCDNHRKERVVVADSGGGGSIVRSSSRVQ